MARLQQQRPGIDTVLFDLDGTLADTAPDIAAALNHVLEGADRPALPYSVVRNHVSRGSSALIALAFGDGLDDARFQGYRNEFLQTYNRSLCVETRLFAGIEDVLTHLESTGRSWGIVTNKPSWLTDPLVSRLGLAERAACVVSGDTTDERKPHPKPLLHAARLAGVAPERCLYLGDDPRDIQAGNAAGMTTVVAGFGYIYADQDPGAWGADGQIERAEHLLDWLPPEDHPGSPS